MRVTITIYRTTGVNQWRWRMEGLNGRILGASTEAYRRVGDCLKNLRIVTGIYVQRKLDLYKPLRGTRGVLKDEQTHVITGRIQAPLTFKHTFLWR